MSKNLWVTKKLSFTIWSSKWFNVSVAVHDIFQNWLTAGMVKTIHNRLQLSREDKNNHMKSDMKARRGQYLSRISMICFGKMHSELPQYIGVNGEKTFVSITGLSFMVLFVLKKSLKWWWFSNQNTWPNDNKNLKPYGWWKKSCTSWDW